MVSFSSLACTLLAATGVSAARPVAEHSAAFLEFTRTYAKSYCDGAAMPCEESMMREAIFQENQAFIKTHNAKYEAGESSYYVATNQVSHCAWTCERKMQRALLTLEALRLALLSRRT
eukprot:scaffold1535_cov382-Prasinococcus_capsulatus_cf.AAC.10